MAGTSTITTRFTLRVPNEFLDELRVEADRRGMTVAAVLLERAGWSDQRPHDDGTRPAPAEVRVSGNT